MPETAGNAYRKTRMRQLLYRSWRRGTQDGDLLLSPFADIARATLDDERLDQFLALLDCTDPDLCDWLIAGIPPPPAHDHAIMRLVRSFCATVCRTYDSGERGSLVGDVDEG